MSFVAGMGIANCDLIYTGLKRLPHEGEELYSSGFGMYLGGGASATMITLSRLNVPVVLGTFLGKDQFSEFVKKELECSKTNYVNLYEGKGMPVTISSIMNTPSDRTIVSYHDAFELTNDEKNRIIDKMNDSGIVIMHREFYDIYNKIDKQGKLFIFDTSWIDGMSLSYFEPFFHIADYCTPNEKEAIAITGASSLPQALDILGNYFKNPIIKVGKDGCIYKDDGVIKNVPALPNIIPVDYTGAGDAFLAGFIYGLHHSYSIEDCIIFGNVTGGLSVEEIGCTTRHISEQELLDCARKIKSIM